MGARKPNDDVPGNRITVSGIPYDPKRHAKLKEYCNEKGMRVAVAYGKAMDQWMRRRGI